MKLTPFGILFAVIATLAIIYVLQRLRRDAIGIRAAVTWLLLWLAIGFFSLFPTFLDTMMQLAQMENRVLFILLTAVLILFALVFNLSSRLDHQQRDIARLVQELSILNARLDDTNPPSRENDKK